MAAGGLYAPRHLYVHVPFCRARCDYCDFYSLALGEPAAAGTVRSCSRADPHASAADRSAALLDRYVAAVIAEWDLERVALGVGRLRSVYVGGGTPSLLGARRLQRLLSAFDRHLTAHAEVTVETNPEDVTAAYARWAAGRGLRVSLGAQSFVPRLRVALGRRAHADPAAAFRRLRAAGCRNVGIDLMVGTPGQTEADLETDLAAVAGLRPDHVSWYELDLVAGTALAMRLGLGDGGDAAARSDGEAGAAARSDGEATAPPPTGAATQAVATGTRPDGDVRAVMYREVVRGLERLGYRWYEVSNFAAPGRRCRHNSAVWRGEDYVGLGPGAVGTVGDRRRRNAPDLSAYLAALAPDPRAPAGAALAGGRAAPTAGVAATASGGASGVPVPPPREPELLGPSERARERLYLAARTGAAVPLHQIDEVLDQRAMGPLAQAGFVRAAGGTLRVTRKGRFVADDVCVRLFRASCVQGTTAAPPRADNAIASRETA